MDDKKLASWNALALRALLEAEAVDDDKRRRMQTDRMYRFITGNFIKGDQVMRMAGSSGIAETTLSDYAHLARALQAYAVARQDDGAARQARELVEAAFNRYYRDGRWLQHGQSLIPGEPGEWVIRDSVLESPFSLLLEAMLLMPDQTPGMQQQARTLVFRLTEEMLDLPFHYATAILLRHRFQQQVKAESKIESEK